VAAAWCFYYNSARRLHAVVGRESVKRVFVFCFFEPEFWTLVRAPPALIFIVTVPFSIHTMILRVLLACVELSTRRDGEYSHIVCKRLLGRRVGLFVMVKRRRRVGFLRKFGGYVVLIVVLIALLVNLKRFSATGKRPQGVLGV